MSSLAEQFKDLMANFDKGQLIGIDIGLSAVKVAFMSNPKKDVYKLERYASIPLSEAAIIEDEVQKPEEVIEAIQEAIAQTKIGSRIACLGIDGPNTMTKRLQVPDGTKEDVEDNIMWESEQYIPFGVDESEVDYFVLKHDREEDVQDAIVAATKLSVIEKYSNIVKEAGLIPKVIDLNVFAINNLFEVVYANDLDELSSGGTIIIDFGAQTTTIIVYKDGGPILTKEINIGGVLVTEEIQRQMGVSYEEAEDLKTFGDESGNIPEDIVPIIQMQIQQLLDEIKKVLNFYIAAGSSDQASSCMITGGSCRLPGLKEALQDLIELEVHIMNPFDAIEYEKKNIPNSELYNIATNGFVAMGLGLRKI